MAAGKVRIGVQIAEDEIDLDGGFVMAPEAIPQPTPVTPGVPIPPQGPTPVPASGGFGGSPTLPQPGGARAPATPKTVEFNFAADRNQLFTAWQALANLADLCGKVAVTVKGEPPISEA